MTLWHMKSTLIDCINLLEKNKFRGLTEPHVVPETVILIVVLKCLDYKQF